MANGEVFVLGQVGRFYGDLYRVGLWHMIPQQGFSPESFTISRGLLVSGDLSSLTDIDGNELVVRKGIVLNPTEAPVTIVFDGHTTVAQAKRLKFLSTLRTSSTGLGATLDLWDWSANNGAGGWDPQDVSGGATGLNEKSYAVEATNPQRYLSVAGAMRARIRVKQIGPVTTQSWNGMFDQAGWEVTP